MRFEDGLFVDEGADAVREATRGFFLGEGYDEIEATNDHLAFRRERARLASWGGFRSECLPTRLDVRIRSRVGTDAKGTSIRIAYDVRTRWHIVTRVDVLYYELEIAALERYIATGIRRSARDMVAPVRRPITTAVVLNVGMSTMLIAIVGTLARLPFGLSVSIALAVALANVVAILGFADILVEAMDEVGRRR